ncbi:hypothetical protein C1646_677072 [Rhizophagus diaphanus]|nr:hypothetical protein C1646_677072 [Rhizophagus diaphanus] [Rhizophagus sp. MUCL 43196]
MVEFIRWFHSKDQDILTNPEISFENIAQFAKVANELQWKGPVVLMTDCTKLRLKKIKEQDAIATQIHVFLLKIPISKIPPVIIAALPTKGDVIAEEISNHLLTIIEMTAHCNINLVSFGADGVITEMKAQQIVIEHPSASGVLEFKASLYEINFKVPIFDNRPIVMHRDKILRTGDFGMKKEKFSATGYIFDFNSNDMSAKVLELLRQWPTQDEIHGAIQIAYLNVEKFARLVALSKSETSLYPFVYIDNSHLDTEQEYAEVNTAINFNLLISENDQLYDIAKEVAQTAFINQNEELCSFVNNVNDNSIFGEYDELGGLNEDLESYVSRSSDQMDNLSKINSNEIIYLLNHQRSVTIPTILAEPEEFLFDNHDGLDVLKALIIHESHNVFSRADHLCEIQNRSAFNLDEGLQNRIERNAANELVRSLQENDSYVKSRPRLKC